MRGADGTQLIKVDENRIRTKFLCEYLKTVEITNANKYERHFKYLKDITIPMISLQMQDQLLSTISTYESKIAQARAIMDGCAARKQEILNKYLQ